MNTKKVIQKKEFLDELANIYSATDFDQIFYNNLRKLKNCKIDDLNQTTYEIVKNFMENVKRKKPQIYYVFDLLVHSLMYNDDSWEKKDPKKIKPNVVTKIIQLCETEIDESTDENPFTHLYLGSIYHIDEKNLHANTEFIKAKNNPQTKSIVRDYRRGCLTTKVWPTRPFTQQATELQIKLNWETKEPSKTEKFIISYNCDDIYFKAFHKEILSAILSQNNTVKFGLHFHIINMTKESRAIIKHISKKLQNIPISLYVTSEKKTVSERAYFTISRFLLLESLLHTFKSDIIVMDADSHVCLPPEHIWNDLKGADIASLLTKNKNNDYPWTSIWAGFLYVKYSTNGRKYAQLLRETIQYMWKESDNWWIDQHALYIASQLIKAKLPKCTYINIEQKHKSYMVSGEKIKLSGLESIPEYARLRKQGKPWAKALYELQIKPHKQVR